MIIPEKVTYIFLLVANGLFVGAGVGMLALGIYQYSSNPQVVEVMDSSMPNGVLNIVTGGLDIVVGTCGLIGALLKKRLLLMANAGILAAVILGNLVIVIAFPLYGKSAINEAKNTMKNSVLQKYGDNSNEDHRDLSKDIDHHQNKDGCCGWSDSTSDNVFLGTPWFKNINANATGTQWSLPESCCVITGPDCHSTQNLDEARNKGFVFKLDCMTKMIGRVKYFIWVTVAQLLLTSIVQLVVVAFIVLRLIQTAGAGAE